MKHFSEVIKIIEGAIRNDTKKVLDYSLLLAGKLESDGESVKSQRISKILSKSGCLMNDDGLLSAADYQPNTNIKQIPFDQESKLELADILFPHQIEEKRIILSEENEKQINEFVLSYENADKLASFGLEIASSMILFGPPGCGKTETALSIAYKLKLPIIIARLDTLISSYLGSTSKNIRILFDYASKTPCILFLDEFDALAKQRDDIHEMGELKRVVNSLLQNIDSLNNNSILIASTNHEKLLDEAIWRRFSTRINIKLPEYNLISKYMLLILSEVNSTLDGKSIDFLSCLFKGQSFADIEQISKRSFRKAVLDNRSVVLADFVDSFFSYTQIEFNKLEEDADLTRRNKIKYLLSIKENLSNRILGEALSCHHNTIKSDLEKIKSGE